MSNELKRYAPYVEFWPEPYAALAPSDTGKYVLHSDALAAIEAARPRWEPIDTAPIDEDLLILCSYGICQGWKTVDQRDGNVMFIANAGGVRLWQPTHWMRPLPLPQKASK